MKKTINEQYEILEYLKSHTWKETANHFNTNEMYILRIKKRFENGINITGLHYDVSPKTPFDAETIFIFNKWYDWAKKNKRKQLIKLFRSLEGLFNA